MSCDFSYRHYREIVHAARQKGYRLMRMQDYTTAGKDDRVLLLRHDVDVRPKCAERLARFERDIGVKSTYFVRVHTDLYNPFSYEVYPLLRSIVQMGHEIGLHFENLDFSQTTREDASSILRREIDVIQSILGGRIHGIAAHRDLFSAVCNEGVSASDYALTYEAHTLTEDCLFASDSLRIWTHTNGQCVCKILLDTRLSAPRICLLTHPEFWYENPSELEHL